VRRHKQAHTANNHNLVHLQAVPSLDPQHISLQYSKLCATSITPLKHHSSAKHNACAADLQQQAVKAATVKARQAAVVELAERLNTTGIRTMQSAIPEDMLVYLTQHWLPNHAESSTSAGELIAAPSSLSGIKSHLAKDF